MQYITFVLNIPIIHVFILMQKIYIDLKSWFLHHLDVENFQ